MTLDFTLYEGYQSISDILADNSETMDFVRMSVSWGVENDGIAGPVLLMLIDLHFTDKLTGETNLPIAAFRSVLSAPLTEVAPEPQPG